MRIPVFSECRIIAFCAPEQAARIARARNAEIVRARKTKQIVRINLRSMGDESGERSIGSVGPTYEELLDAGHVNVLSIIGANGVFRRWGANDGFNPRRFNPDTLPQTPMERLRARTA
jgi:hypothetical protein